MSNPINRSHIMRRAWQLTRWNRKTANQSLSVKGWLKMAWAEWKQGKEWDLDPEPFGGAPALRAQIFRLEHTTRLGVIGQRQLAQANQSLMALAA
jgi:hypothetical protein